MTVLKPNSISIYPYSYLCVCILTLEVCLSTFEVYNALYFNCSLHVYSCSQSLFILTEMVSLLSKFFSLSSPVFYPSNNCTFSEIEHFFNNSFINLITQYCLTFSHIWSNFLPQSSKATVNPTFFMQAKAVNHPSVWINLGKCQINTEQSWTAYNTLGYLKWERGRFGCTSKLRLYWEVGPGIFKIFCYIRLLFFHMKMLGTIKKLKQEYDISKFTQHIYSFSGKQKEGKHLRLLCQRM